MKKIITIIPAVLAFFFAGCEAEQAPVQTAPEKVSKVFSVSMPDTRTTLDGLSVKWAAGDEINVIGINASNTVTEHTFTLTSGAGTSSAMFSGEVNSDETTFYAVYPNIAIDITKLTSNGRINLKNNLVSPRDAVKNGFDSAAAVMAAKDESGTLAFKHLMAYLKIKVGVEGVTSIKVTSSNCKGLNGKANITIPDMATVSVDGSTTYDISIASPTGPFEKDATYFIPVCVKASTLKTVTVEYTFSDAAVASIQTTKLNSTTLEAGKIYDLGTPPITKPTGPVVSLSKTSVADVEPDAASGLTIESAYVIANGSDADINVTTDGTVVTAASVSGGTVTYTVSENTGTARKGWIGLQTGTEEVKKIEINQKGSAAIVLTNITTTTTWGATFWGELYDAEGSSAVQKDFIVGNLGFVNGSGGSGFKFDKSKGQVQLAGTGVAGTKCCLQFKVGGPGKVTIECRSAGSSDRTLKVALGTTEKGSIAAPISSGDKNTDDVTISDAVAGDVVNIYSGGSGINIFTITWTPAS